MHILALKLFYSTLHWSVYVGLRVHLMGKRAPLRYFLYFEFILLSHCYALSNPYYEHPTKELVPMQPNRNMKNVVSAAAKQINLP